MAISLRGTVPRGVSQRPAHGPLAALLVGFTATAVCAATARAETAVPPEDVAAIARTLNCPICQGYNLQDCPLPVCADMREAIRQRLASGESRQQIVDAFVSDYGPQVLNAPPRRGFLAAAWLVPPLAVILIVAAAAAALGKLSRHVPAPAEDMDLETAEASSQADAAALAELERLAEELQR